MTGFEDAARATVDHLDALGLAHALVGGFAVSVWCEPRFTRDIDLVVSVSDDDVAEATVRALVQEGYAVLMTVEQEAAGRLATVRLSVGPAGDLVDLLFASSGIEAEIAMSAERIEVLPGLVLPVATAGHLIALKLLASDARTRPQDGVDLRALIGVAEEEDLEVAHRAVELIEERGFQRGRDLVGALEQLVASR
ncbi:MAG: nucleotidyl transferase AbiEii/AbiGii toxin family protein [Acidimicrobiales bacterium]